MACFITATKTSTFSELIFQTVFYPDVSDGDDGGGFDIIGVNLSNLRVATLKSDEDSVNSISLL